MLPEFLDGPRAIALLTVVLTLALRYQRGMTWLEYKQFHRLKRLVFPTLDHVAPGGFRTFVTAKGYRDDAEYLLTRAGSVNGVWRTLVDAGGSPHLINAIKRRETPEGVVQYSAAHVVWSHPDGTQTEAYLFQNADGSIDVYVHHETSVTDPDGHLSDPQTDGDPRGVVTEALEASDA